jgi:hypothetical protein
MRLAIKRVQFACNWRPQGSLCMQLAATRLQDKRQADNRGVKGGFYIIIIFFFNIAKSTSLTHAFDYSADDPWIFGLENALVLWMT